MRHQRKLFIPQSGNAKFLKSGYRYFIMSSFMLYDAKLLVHLKKTQIVSLIIIQFDFIGRQVR